MVSPDGLCDNIVGLSFILLLRLPQPLHDRLLSNHTIDHKRNPRADHGKDQCRKHDRSNGILKPEKPEHFFNHLSHKRLRCHNKNKRNDNRRKRIQQSLIHKHPL